MKTPQITSNGACKRRLVDVFCYKKGCHSSEKKKEFSDLNMDKVLNTANCVAFFASLIAISCGVGFTYMLCTMHQCQCSDTSPAYTWELNVIFKEVDSIIQIEKLKALLNKISKEKEVEELRGLLKLNLSKSKRTDIGQLRMRLYQMILDRDQQYESGNYYYNRFQQRQKELHNEKQKYADLKKKNDKIMQNVCGCQRCRNNQTPNNWAYVLFA